MNGSSGAQSFGELFSLFTSEELQRTRQEAALLLIDSLLSGHCSTPFVDESVYWKSLLAQPLSTSAFPSRPMGPIQQQPMPPPPMEEPAYSLQPLMPVSALPVMMEPNCVQALRADEEAPPAPVEHPSPAHSSAGSSSNFSAATSPSISPNLLAKRSQSPASPVCAEAKRCEWHDCSRIFDTQEAFLEHMRLDHLAELSLAASHCPRAIVCRWRRCERGQKPFGAVYMLCQHLRAHTGEKPYHCEVPNCGKRYSRLENLKTHQRKHSGEKPYRCAFCVRSFTNASDKAKHEVRVHVNKEKKQYPCTVGGCDCAYTDPSSLRKHTLACHGQACWLEHKARRQVVRRHSQNQQQQPEQ